MKLIILALCLSLTACTTLKGWSKQVMSLGSGTSDTAVVPSEATSAPTASRPADMPAPEASAPPVAAEPVAPQNAATGDYSFGATPANPFDVR